MRGGASRRWRLWLPTLSLVLAPCVSPAQQAVVSGRVAAEGSSEGLADRRVMISDSSTVTVTNSEGRYTFRNVPAGTIEIRVIRVGYQEQKKTVACDRRAVGHARLSRWRTAIVQLQEVVTTATGEQRKVELGNTVSTIDAARRVETDADHEHERPARRQGAGRQHPGAAEHDRLGAGQIRIRGLNSLSLEQRSDLDRRRRPLELRARSARASAARRQLLNDSTPRRSRTSRS